MKIERWEGETDKEWNERLTEETTLANNTETTKYFIESDPIDETRFIINYIGEDGLLWKEHPNGPFNAKQVLEWRKMAEKYDQLIGNPYLTEEYKGTLLDILLDQGQKLEAIKTLVESESHRMPDIGQSGDKALFLAKIVKMLEAEG